MWGEDWGKCLHFTGAIRIRTGMVGESTGIPRSGAKILSGKAFQRGAAEGW